MSPPHGGPHLRDAWGYDYTAQLFANRGYAFMRVNFRGSRGFGRRFRVSSFKQWGGTMRQDIEDAVAFAVGRGLADKSRVAIIGHSYGGYVVLAGLTMTPDLYACGAASSTTPNLMAFVTRFPLTPITCGYARQSGIIGIRRMRPCSGTARPRFSSIE